MRYKILDVDQSADSSHFTESSAIHLRHIRSMYVIYTYVDI